MEHFTLNNGLKMPKIGLGVFNINNKDEDAIVWALKNGYRHLDTAAAYRNEEMVANAIRKSGLKRSDVFITSKIWSSDLGKKTRRAFETSLHKLQTDYIDLYLIHWPAKHYLDSWMTMESLLKEGKIRAIGVSNFEQHHLENLMKHGTIKPSVNQIQTNPYLQQEKLHGFMRKHGIQHVSWGPFGHGNKQMLAHPLLTEIAEKHGKTTAQVILRWSIQRDIAVIPKSISPARLEQNRDVFDFGLSDEEMRSIAALDQNKRGLNDPQKKWYVWATRFMPLSQTK